MADTTAGLVDHVPPHALVSQWVLSLAQVPPWSSRRVIEAVFSETGATVTG